MNKTSIEWTDTVWNPVVGCTRCSPGCANCYAFALHDMRHAAYQSGKRLPVQYALPFSDVQLMPDRLQDPLRWKKPRRVFVNSMGDLFHKDIPDEFIDQVFAVMAICRQHTFQVLTKRSERMRDYFAGDPAIRIGGHLGTNGHNAMATLLVADIPISDTQYIKRRWPLPNIWLGISVEDQHTADMRIPHLLETPAVVRFLSCEPLLGPIDLSSKWLPPGKANWQCQQCGGFFRDRGDCQHCHAGQIYSSGSHAANKPDPSSKFTGWTNRQPIDWVIVGGESGLGSRPCDLRWIRSIVEQCKVAGIPCFVKQLGKLAIETTQLGYGHQRSKSLRMTDPKGGDVDEFPEDLRIRQFPEVTR